MEKMWFCLVVLEKELLPKLEVKVLVLAGGAEMERSAALKIALDTPLPFDFQVEESRGRTPRALGYHMTCYYQLQRARPPLVVDWYY